MTPLGTDTATLRQKKWRGAGLRLLLVGYLGAVALACVALLYGLLFSWPELVLAGGLSAAAAYLLRLLLQGKLEAGEGQAVRFDEVDDEISESDSGRVGDLVGLLREWERLERTRGSARFDPWELQSVRREIRMAVDDDQCLEQLFRH
jgi:hypothetical protein